MCAIGSRVWCSSALFLPRAPWNQSLTGVYPPPHQVLIHAGPFANIAHGNSSIIADKIALKLVGQVTRGAHPLSRALARDTCHSVAAPLTAAPAARPELS